MHEEVESPLEASPAALALAWRAVGRRIAVIAGSTVALLSLMQHTPVHIASLRGALVWSAILATTTIGAWLAEKTWHLPAQDPAPEPTAPPE